MREKNIKQYRQTSQLWRHKRDYAQSLWRTARASISLSMALISLTSSCFQNATSYTRSSDDVKWNGINIRLVDWQYLVYRFAVIYIGHTMYMYIRTCMMYVYMYMFMYIHVPVHVLYVDVLVLVHKYVPLSLIREKDTLNCTSSHQNQTLYIASFFTREIKNLHVEMNVDFKTE